MGAELTKALPQVPFTRPLPAPVAAIKVNRVNDPQVSSMSLDHFREMVNSSIKSLQKQGFEVLNCHKLSQKVSELKIQRKDSEILSREVVFLIDIETQRCFVKKMQVSNTLTGQKK